ncbi:hypothetical protein IJ707_01735 [bacterium]|nr:hypothetical protein [bacterium]
MGNVNGVNGTNNQRRIKHPTMQTHTEEPVSLWTVNRSQAEVTQSLPAGTKKSEPQKEQSLLDRAKTASEKAILKSGTLAKHAGMPVAGELLELSLMSDEERAAQVRADGGQVLTPEQARKKMETLNMREGDNNHTQPDQMDLQTVVFGKDSKMSQEVQNNRMLQSIVQNWVDNGAEEGAILGFNTADSGSFDLRMGLGYSQVVGLHRTADGYVEGYVEDVYDYDPSYNKGKDEESNLLKRAKSKAVQTLNDMAVDLQEKGELQRYRSLIPIRVKVQ